MIVKKNHANKQIIQPISRSWNTSINDLAENGDNLIMKGYHLIKSQRIYCYNSLNSEEIYDILIVKNAEMPSLQQFYNKLFRDAHIYHKKYLYIATHGYTRN